MRFHILLILALLAASCSNTGLKSYSYGDSDSKLIIETKTTDEQQYQGEGMKYATIETSKGKIKAELYVKEAPITTANFISLADSKFYDGLTFHRVEPGFVVQGGDPSGDGTGGSSKNIALEINPKLKHVKGALGMARSSDPNSASSQFYITLDAAHFLDGNYAVFGKVLEGMNVAEQLEVGDKMDKVYISDK